MKIIVPSDGKDMQSQVSTVLGRAPYFIVVDSDTMSYECIDNPATQAAGGAGIVAAQAILETGADIVITYQCGKNAADVLEQGNIQMVAAKEGPIEQLIESFNAGQLQKSPSFHGGHHQHGGQ